MKDEALTQLSDKLEEIMEEENNHLQYLRSRATFQRNSIPKLISSWTLGQHRRLSLPLSPTYL